MPSKWQHKCLQAYKQKKRAAHLINRQRQRQHNENDVQTLLNITNCHHLDDDHLVRTGFQTNMLIILWQNICKLKNQILCHRQHKFYFLIHTIRKSLNEFTRKQIILRCWMDHFNGWNVKHKCAKSTICARTHCPTNAHLYKWQHRLRFATKKQNKIKKQSITILKTRDRERERERRKKKRKRKKNTPKQKYNEKNERTELAENNSRTLQNIYMSI